MKSLVLKFLLIFMLFACENKDKKNSIDPINWQNKKVQLTDPDQLIYGSTYLSIYSEVYARNIHKTFALTVTVSMRNISSEDSIYITKAEYYHTSGLLSRTYFDFPILLKPMETIEIVVDQDDKEGGTGGNFIFEWGIRYSSKEPLFEAVMISTNNQQGISFTTQGVKR